MIKIVCISDTHNKHKNIQVGDGDILIHAGDATGRGMSGEIIPFLNWYAQQNFKHKVLIAGNHDFGFETEPGRYEEACEKLGIIYLNDSGAVIEGLNFWGSPVQPEFFNWAFNRRINLDVDYGPVPWKNLNPPIKPHWDLIPDNTDVLITHGPPLNMLDEVRDPFGNRNVGCPHLLGAVERVKPKLHVFGHIHEEQGVCVDSAGTTFVNASQLNDQYVIAYKPKILYVDSDKKVYKA